LGADEAATGVVLSDVVDQACQTLGALL